MYHVAGFLRFSAKHHRHLNCKNANRRKYLVMFTQKKLLFFTVFTITIYLAAAEAASAQPLSRDEAISYFLGKDSVRQMLLFDNNKMSLLFDKELKRELNTNAPGYSGNDRFKWINDRLLEKSIKRDNCSVYTISCIRKQTGWEVDITQACSNLFCNGTIAGSKQNPRLSSFTLFAR